MDSNEEDSQMEHQFGSDSRYEYIRNLGIGAYGRVDECKHKETGKVYAIKTSTFHDLAESGIPSNAMREVSLLRELDHPNIIKIEDVIYTKPHLFLIMEFMEYDLKKYLAKEKSLTNGDIQSIMRQILEGV